MHSEQPARTAASLSAFSRHLYAFILILLLMLAANNLWPAARVRDCRPVERPPSMKACDVYPAPHTLTP